MEQVPLRIQRWILSLQAFDFEIKHVKGKENVIADTLSRFPSSTTTSGELEMSNDWVILNVSADLVNIKDIENHNVEDTEFETLSKFIDKNWSMPKDTNADVYHNFHPLRDSLSFNDTQTIIFVGDRVLLPKALRERVLKIAHETHTGAEKMKQILRAYFFWPKMAHDI